MVLDSQYERDCASHKSDTHTFLYSKEGYLFRASDRRLHRPYRSIRARAQLQKRVSASAAARAGGGGTSVGDEVDRYLAELPVSDVPALQYWQRARNMDTLRQMARDYLAIPATSAASERAFSMGRNLISLHTHRLNTERVSASMTLRSWYTSHPGKSIGEEPGRSGEQAPPELALEGEGLDEGDEVEAVAVGGGTGVE
ncbi:unnamed protein product [Closterium sp. NIES-53]